MPEAFPPHYPNGPLEQEAEQLAKAVLPRAPEARPNFASRVKTPYNGSFGAEGEIKHACRLVFLRRVRPHASVALAELVQLQKSAGRE
jgi:hypothetical protein